MKNKPCTLIVNSRWGYIFTPIKCSSIAEARRRGKEYPGFAYRIIVKEGDSIRTIRGFCEDI